MIFVLITFDCGWLNTFRRITMEATVEKNMLTTLDLTETECHDQSLIR